MRADLHKKKVIALTLDNLEMKRDIDQFAGHIVYQHRENEHQEKQINNLKRLNRSTLNKMKDLRRKNKTTLNKYQNLKDQYNKQKGEFNLITTNEEFDCQIKSLSDELNKVNKDFDKLTIENNILKDRFDKLEYDNKKYKANEDVIKRYEVLSKSDGPRDSEFFKLRALRNALCHPG